MLNNVPSLLMFKLLFLAQNISAGISILQLKRIQHFKSLIKLKTLCIYSIIGGKIKSSK